MTESGGMAARENGGGTLRRFHFWGKTWAWEYRGYDAFFP